MLAFNLMLIHVAIMIEKQGPTKSVKVLLSNVIVLEKSQMLTTVCTEVRVKTNRKVRHRTNNSLEVLTPLPFPQRRIYSFKS